MKLPEPGIASVASEMIKNSAASTGALNAMPPSSASDSLPRARSAITPTMRNSGTTTSPWFSIWRIAPWAPFPAKAKIPSTMKPSCAIDEYASTSRMLSWENARTDPYRIEKTARMMNSSCQCCGAAGHDRQDDPQEGVDAHLRQHPGQERQHRDRRRAVGLRHPPVQREQRRLHEEGEREQQHDPLLRPEGHGMRAEVGQRERDAAAVAAWRAPRARSPRPSSGATPTACRSRTWWWPARGRRCPSRRSGSRTARASGRRRR